VIEKAGGSAGYEKWLASQKSGSVAKLEEVGGVTYANSVAATLTLIPYAFGAYVELSTTDGHDLSGFIWGITVVESVSVGTFSYNDFGARSLLRMISQWLLAMGWFVLPFT